GWGVGAGVALRCVVGRVMALRWSGKNVVSTEDVLKSERFRTGMLDLLSGCVGARLNIVISGGSGAGKTTILNTLSRFIPEEERIVTIEDTAELQVQRHHVVRLETRPGDNASRGAALPRGARVN